MVSAIKVCKAKCGLTVLLKKMQRAFTKSALELKVLGGGGYSKNIVTKILFWNPSKIQVLSFVPHVLLHIDLQEPVHGNNIFVVRNKSTKSKQNNLAND